jgi:hypothetical protein
MSDASRELIAQLREAWPPVFAGIKIAELSGGALNWGTIQNKRSRHEIPDDCFVRSGPTVLVIRDRFLDHWVSTFKDARAPIERPIPRRTRARKAKALIASTSTAAAAE